MRQLCSHRAHRPRPSQSPVSSRSEFWPPPASYSALPLSPFKFAQLVSVRCRLCPTPWLSSPRAALPWVPPARSSVRFHGRSSPQGSRLPGSPFWHSRSASMLTGCTGERRPQAQLRVYHRHLLRLRCSCPASSPIRRALPCGASSASRVVGAELPNEALMPTRTCVTIFARPTASAARACGIAQVVRLSRRVNSADSGLGSECVLAIGEFARQGCREFPLRPRLGSSEPSSNSRTAAFGRWDSALGRVGT